MITRGSPGCFDHDNDEWSFWFHSPRYRRIIATANAAVKLELVFADFDETFLRESTLHDTESF